jgi:peptide/nickel transport system permease protein
MRLRSSFRLIVPALLLSVALLGPSVVGPPDPPSVAASAIQLLPPGALIQQVPLEGGGFVRALEIQILDEGIQLRSPDGWRMIPRLRPSGSPRTLRLWLGSDHQGRSLAARIVHGARTTLLVASLATLVAVLLGTGVGLASALASRSARGIIEIGTDGLLGLPRLLLLLMLGVLLRGSGFGIGLAIGLASWMEVARLVQAEALKLRARPFVATARVAGAGTLRIAFRHLLPNLAPLLAVAAPLVATEAILLESTLSFLGVVGGSDGGSWGKIVADGQRLLPDGWWIVLFPGLLLCATALAVHGLAQREARRSYHLTSS